MKRIAIVFAAAPALLYAQVPFMLKDVTPGTDGSYYGNWHLRTTNEVLFDAYALSNTTVTGVYRTDGSIPGTYKLRDAGLCYFSDFGPTHTYFVTNTAGYCLWKTNGQVAGTDSVPTPGVVSAKNLYSLGPKMVFVGTTTANTQYLWGSDGSIAGTAPVSPSFTAVTIYTVVNNVLFFSVNTATSGTEMWRTDGTAAGTFELKDIRPGAASSFSTYPVRAISGNRIYFIANDGTSGDELYSSDGTTAGTNLLADINPGSGSGLNYNYYHAAPNGLYFIGTNSTSGSELWFTDGTPSNTQMIRDVATGAANAIPSAVPVFTNGFAYYFYNNAHSVLYKSNGTSAGTTTLVVATASVNGKSIRDDRMWFYNGNLYYATQLSFSSMSNPSGDSLFMNKVDLNLSSSVVIDKLELPYQVGSFSYFFTNSTSQQGPRLIYIPHGSNANASVLIFNLSTLTHKLFANYGNGMEVFGYPFTGQPVFGNKMYFPFQPSSNEPAYLDLMTDSIKLLKLVEPGTAYSCGSSGVLPWHYDIYSLNNKAYFLANESGYGLELFGTDFTPGGTARLLDINAGSGDFDNGSSQNSCLNKSFRFLQAPNNIYFLADDVTHGLEIWALVTTSVTPPPPTTGVNEVNRHAIAVFPNPAKSDFTVKSDAAFDHVTITAITGAVVADKTCTGTSASINCAGLPRGIYFVTASGDSWKKTVKVVID